MPAWLGIAGIVRLGPWLTARMLAPGSRAPDRGPPARGVAGPAPRPAGARPGLDRPVRRRLCGIIIDWVIALVIARGLFQVPLPFSEGTATGGQNFIVLGIFAVMNILLVGTLGTTIGHRLMGLQVRNVTGGRATLRSGSHPDRAAVPRDPGGHLGPGRPRPARQGAQHGHRPHPLTTGSWGRPTCRAAPCGPCGRASGRRPWAGEPSSRRAT